MGTLLRPQITIHLDAVRENYARIRKYAPNAEICPVVKSQAYGLRPVEIVRSLIACGCRNFYVSTVPEGIELRDKFSDIQVNVFNGLQEETEEVFSEYRLTPVVNSVEQMKRWECMAADAKTDCVLNVETGFNRLGIQEKDWSSCTSETWLKRNRVSLFMTHFACVAEGTVDDPERRRIIEEQNRRQYAAYGRALQRFCLPGSVALDAFVQNTEKLPIAQVRTGAALYGVCVFPGKLDLCPTITLKASVLQVTILHRGERVGYGATWEAKKDTIAAVVNIGHGHGLPRSLSNRGTVWFYDRSQRYAAPVIGRVAMGLTVCDVTDVPMRVLDNGEAIILDERYTINDLCIDADRSDCEILCNFKEMDWRYID